MSESGQVESRKWASRRDNYPLWLKITTSPWHSESQTNYMHYCEGLSVQPGARSIQSGIRCSHSVSPPSDFPLLPLSLVSPVELSGRWVELPMKPVITARVASHSASQTLVNWGLGGEDIQLHMPPFVAVNYWFEDYNLVSPSPSRMGHVYLTDQKVAALPPFFCFHCSRRKILLTFAHVNLPAAVFYCLHGDILEGSLRPTGELRSWWQSSDHFLHLVPFSWGGYHLKKKKKTEAGGHQAPITSNIVLRIHSHGGEFHPPLLPRALSPLQIPHSHRCTRIRTHQHAQIDR